MYIYRNIKIVLAIAACFMLLPSDGWAQDYFVQSAVAVLWKAPHENASPVGILEKGTKVMRLRIDNQWCLVKYQSSRGWVLRMLLGDRKPESGLKLKPSGVPLSTPSPIVPGILEQKTGAGGLQPAVSIEH
jgi:hypothetical protein